MPRPKKKKNNMEELSQQVLEAVTEAYLNPTEDTADEHGKMSLNVLAGEFSMSRINLRKLLITSGVYETPIELFPVLKIVWVIHASLKTATMFHCFRRIKRTLNCIMILWETAKLKMLTGRCKTFGRKP